MRTISKKELAHVAAMVGVLCLLGLDAAADSDGQHAQHGGRVEQLFLGNRSH